MVKKNFYLPVQLLFRIGLFLLAVFSLTACRIPSSTSGPTTLPGAQTASPEIVLTVPASPSPATATTGAVPVTGSTETPPVLPATPTINGLIPNTGAQIYIVQEGDNLTQIAAKFGLSAAELETANPQITDPNLIYIGQSIFIPAVRITPTAAQTLSAARTAPAVTTAPSPTPAY
jgi:LysM repeat protein